MSQTVTINGAELKRETDKNEEFLRLAYYAANRQRNRVSTDIRQMRKNLMADEPGLVIDPKKWIMAFQRMEQLGMGSLVIGRNGKATRFKWNYSLKAIGVAAINGLSLEVQRVTPKLRGKKHVHEYHDKALPEVKTALQGRVAAKLSVVPAIPVTSKLDQKRLVEAVKANETHVSHVLHVSLRPDYTFEADLPKLTADEANRICAAIKRCV
jgi:hypothetical protein